MQGDNYCSVFNLPNQTAFSWKKQENKSLSSQLTLSTNGIFSLLILTTAEEKEELSKSRLTTEVMKNMHTLIQKVLFLILRKSSLVQKAMKEQRFQHSEVRLQKLIRRKQRQLLKRTLAYSIP